MFDDNATLASCTPETSLGSRLAAAREAKGLPIEKAAHETRIRVQRLRELENDDLSHFSHPTYARLFLVDYAKYLGVTEEVRSLFPEAGTCGAEGYQYLRAALDKPAPFDPLPRPARRIRLVPALLGGVSILVCIFVAIELLITWRKIDRVRPGHATVAEHTQMEDPSSSAPSSPSAPDPAAAPADSPADAPATPPKAPEATAEAPASEPANGVVPSANTADSSSTAGDAALLAAPTPAPTAAVDAASSAPAHQDAAPTASAPLPTSAEHKPATPLLVGGALDHGSTVR